MHHLRRIALAVAVPVAAVAAVALGAGAATSSPTTNTPLVAASDGQPNQAPTGGGGGETGGGGGQTGGGGGQTGGGQTQAPGGGTTGQQSFQTFKTLTKSPGSTTKATTSASKSTTSASRSTVSPSTSSPKPTSARPTSPGTGGGIGGVPIRNCTGKTVTTPLVVKVGTAGNRQALVDGAGCALYLNNQDTPQQSVCTGACLTTWPPAIAPGQAGDGVQQANLGAFTRPEGGQQLTAFGHQLYYFQGDTAPGQANGQANAQTWFLVDPSGNAITQ